jgi:LysR family glycine cleavage system transcriptional activator
MPDILATIPLSAIRVFEAAARLNSFTRAAAELGITQAAVSWQVKALERRLDQALFLRLPREVALTASGERLSRAATEAMTTLRVALSDLSESGEGVLSITALPSLANLWLAPRIGAFQLQHSKIAVRLDTHVRLVDLGRENIDVAIRSGTGIWPGLETHYLFPNIHTPICTPQTLQALGLERPEDVLRGHLLGAADEWEVWFQAAGVRARPDPAERPRLSGDSQALEVASAISTGGVALASPLFFASEIDAGRLVVPFEAYAHYTDGHFLAYRAERARAPKIRAFREWLLESIAKDPLFASYPRRVS